MQVTSYDMFPKRLEKLSEFKSQEYQRYTQRFNTFSYFLMFVIIDQCSVQTRAKALKHLINVYSHSQSILLNLEFSQHIRMALINPCIQNLEESLKQLELISDKGATNQFWLFKQIASQDASNINVSMFSEENRHLINRKPFCPSIMQLARFYCKMN